MPEPATQANDTIKLDNSPIMAMTTLYGAAIGPIGSDYYLPVFERFEAAGQGTLSWNWSACLYNLNWLIFRGLWGAAMAFAGALIGLSVVLVVVGLLAFDWPPETLTVVLLACLVLACVATGAWGNALLYNHSRAAMMTAVANNKTLAQACAELSQRASSRTRFLRILAGNAALIALIGVATVMTMRSGDNREDSPERQAMPAVADLAQPAPPASAAASAASAAESAASGTETSASAPAPKVSNVAPSASAPAMAASAATSIPGVPMTPLAKSATESTASAPAHTSSAPAPEPTLAASKEVKAAKPAAAIKTRSPASATDSTQEFYVNAGLFADTDNARRTLARLTEAGLPATAQELPTSHGARTRVRVGPFTKRDRAEAAIKQIKDLKLDAVLAKP